MQVLIVACIFFDFGGGLAPLGGERLGWGVQTMVNGRVNRNEGRI